MKAIIDISNPKIKELYDKFLSEASAVAEKNDPIIANLSFDLSDPDSK